jgi:hypothetical protein
MGGDTVIQANGPYLRVVLPDFEPDWVSIWSRIAFELDDGIERAEIVAPCYPDEGSVEGVRALAERLDTLGVDTIVEWQGIPPTGEEDPVFVSV